MKRLKFKQLLNIFAVWAFVFNAAAADRNYDELRTEDGQLRTQYRALEGYFKKLTEEKTQWFLNWSKKRFSKDNALDPIPRIIPGEEYDQLKKGVEQRAQALRAFLQDHYSGKKSYAKAGVISEQTVDAIIYRAGETAYKGLIDASLISFMYGPDIIRDPKGQWRVIEDNPGFIGGLGDLKMAYDLMVNSIPELQRHYNLRDPMDFYYQIGQNYKKRAEAKGGKAILFMTPPYADKEDYRIESLFHQIGIETIAPEHHKKLKFTRHGAYLVYKDMDGVEVKERVGFIFLNGEHAWLDNSHPASLSRNISETANEYINDKKSDPKVVEKLRPLMLDRENNLVQIKALLRSVDEWDDSKSRAKGLTKAILDNRVASNYSPGIDFIGDKEFYLYVEDLIRFYLKEEPLIKNISTRRFADKSGKTDEALMDHVFKNLDQYVVKRVDGRGGDAVWVGPKVKGTDLGFLIDEIRKNPSVYIVQEYTPLSVMNRNIVDVRVISDVAPDKITVTDTPWGRGLPMDGNGKVNLSDQGREVTVLVADKPNSARKCEKAIRITW